MTRKLASTLAIATLVAGSVAACSQGGGSGTSSVSASASATGSRARLASLPLTGLMDMNSESQKVMMNASDKLTGQCMKQKGFDYHSMTSQMGSFNTDEEMPLGMFGLESLKDFPTSGPSGGYTPTKQEQSKAYQEALNGTGKKTINVDMGDGKTFPMPADGCQFEAQNVMFGSSEGFAGFMKQMGGVTKASSDAETAAKANPEMIALNAKWRQCMKKKGFTVTTPQDALKNMPQKISTWKQGKADIDCKTETGYLDTAYRILGKAQQDQIDRNPALATEMKSVMDKILETSKKVLSGEVSMPAASAS